MTLGRRKAGEVSCHLRKRMSRHCRKLMMGLRLMFVDKVRILLLQLLQSHHVLCLLGLGHGHSEVVEA